MWGTCGSLPYDNATVMCRTHTYHDAEPSSIQRASTPGPDSWPDGGMLLADWLITYMTKNPTFTPARGIPTYCCITGLDARAAAIVMRVVRNIVNTGRTIACTIHQPPIDIFEVQTRPVTA